MLRAFGFPEVAPTVARHMDSPSTTRCASTKAPSSTSPTSSSRASARFRWRRVSRPALVRFADDPRRSGVRRRQAPRSAASRRASPSATRSKHASAAFTRWRRRSEQGHGLLRSRTFARRARESVCPHLPRDRSRGALRRRRRRLSAQDLPGTRRGRHPGLARARFLSALGIGAARLFAPAVAAVAGSSAAVRTTAASAPIIVNRAAACCWR